MKRVANFYKARKDLVKLKHYQDGWLRAATFKPSSSYTSNHISSRSASSSVGDTPIRNTDKNGDTKKKIEERGSGFQERINAQIAGMFNEEYKPTVQYDSKQYKMTHSDWTGWLTKRFNYDSVIDDYFKEKKFEQLRAMQEYDSERKKLLGGELAAARFVVSMLGRVKLHNDDHWYRKATTKTKPLPKEKTYNLSVEAVDLSNTDLLYEGIENLFQAKSLLYLNLSNCGKLDEWSISRLAMIPSLVSLDLSGNQFITERCLIPLHHLPNLRRLDLGGIKYFERQPLALMAIEELLPNCVVVNVQLNQTDAEDSKT